MATAGKLLARAKAQSAAVNMRERSGQWSDQWFQIY
jgi:hypothetical protein